MSKMNEILRLVEQLPDERTEEVYRFLISIIQEEDATKQFLDEIEADPEAHSRLKKELAVAWRESEEEEGVDLAEAIAEMRASKKR